MACWFFPKWNLLVGTHFHATRFMQRWRSGTLRWQRKNPKVSAIRSLSCVLVLDWCMMHVCLTDACACAALWLKPIAVDFQQVTIDSNRRFLQQCLNAKMIHQMREAHQIREGEELHQARWRWTKKEKVQQSKPAQADGTVTIAGKRFTNSRSIGFHGGKIGFSADLA